MKFKFRNAGEEIHFFKDIKPQFVSKLIYYNEVYNIETNKPVPYIISDRQVQKWTGSKVELNEFIYALHAQGVFNNGTTDLKETAKFFEETFDIDLAQFHSTFFEMRARKSEKTNV